MMEGLVNVRALSRFTCSSIRLTEPTFFFICDIFTRVVGKVGADGRVLDLCSKDVGLVHEHDHRRVDEPV